MASEDIPRSSTERIPSDSSTREVHDLLSPRKTPSVLDRPDSGIYAKAQSISMETGIPLGDVLRRWNTEFNRIAQEGKPSQRNDDISAPEQDLTLLLQKRLQQKAGMFVLLIALIVLPTHRK